MPLSTPLRAERPKTQTEYGIPASLDGLLAWSWALNRISSARQYWLATTRPDGRPHATPVWGVYIEPAGDLFFGGGVNTVWARNLTHNVHISLHIEDAVQVVIIEGAVERISDPAHPLAATIDAAYKAKYDILHGLPVYRVIPSFALGWQEYPFCTKWVW